MEVGELMVHASSAVGVFDITSLLKPATIPTIGRIQLSMVTRLADVPQAMQRPNVHKPQRQSMVKVAGCPFKFLIGWDKNGYYLIQTAGNHRHDVGHPITDKGIADEQPRKIIRHSI
jgi:hypothetical protein